MPIVITAARYGTIEHTPPGASEYRTVASLCSVTCGCAVSIPRSVVSSTMVS
jgi:hypothetical protein